MLPLALLPFANVSTFSQFYDFSAVSELLPPTRIDALYGGSVLIVLQQGNSGEIYRFSSGSLTSSTRRPIASATKWYSGAILLRLAEEGFSRWTIRWVCTCRS